MGTTADIDAAVTVAADALAGLVAARREHRESAPPALLAAVDQLVAGVAGASHPAPAGRPPGAVGGIEQRPRSAGQGAGTPFKVVGYLRPWVNGHRWVFDEHATAHDAHRSIDEMQARAGREHDGRWFEMFDWLVVHDPDRRLVNPPPTG